MIATFLKDCLMAESTDDEKVMFILCEWTAGTFIYFSVERFLAGDNRKCVILAILAILLAIVGVKWSFIKSLSPSFLPTTEATIAKNRWYMWVILSVLTVAVVVSAGTRIYRHYHGDPEAKTSNPPPIPPPKDPPVQLTDGSKDEPTGPCGANADIEIKTHDFGNVAVGQDSIFKNNWVEIINKTSRPLELTKKYLAVPKRFHVKSGDFFLNGWGTCYQDYLYPSGHRDGKGKYDDRCRPGVVFQPTRTGQLEGEITLAPDGKECVFQVYGIGLPGKASPHVP